jgi:hypothetical protein
MEEGNPISIAKDVSDLHFTGKTELIMRSPG